MEIRKIVYCPHIQNPFNMNEFDDYQSDRPFQAVAVGDVLAEQTFYWGAGGAEKVPHGDRTVRVVGLRHAFAAVLDQQNEPTGTFFDEIWVGTDEEWWQERYG